MINLAANSKVSDESRFILDDIGSRIGAVSVLYDLLYNTNTVREVRLDVYISNVIASLPNKTENITLNISNVPITVQVKNAIYIGIIVAELITNALKYAFPENKKGIIKIEIKKVKKGAVIKITDDGIGLPQGFDILKVDSMGLQLVNIFSGQIKGSFKIKSTKGTKCVLTFPIK